MKYIHINLLVVLLMLIAGCETEADNSKFGPKAKEILQLQYEDITMSLDFKDTTEIARFQESIKFQNGKLELSTKIADDHGAEPMIRYDMMEVDTNTKICVRHYTDYNIREGAIKGYMTDTLEGLVEDRTYQVANKDYSVYKIVEKDPHGDDCRTIFISPQFGTLFGRGEVGRYEMHQQNENLVVDSLVYAVKRDTLFVLCGLQLELYKKRRGKGDAVISPN